MKITVKSLAKLGWLPLLSILSAGPVSAQADLGKTILEKLAARVAKLESACASDIKTQCAGIKPGEGRIKACIKSHLSNLSPTCEDRLLTVAITGKACKTDLAKLCAGIVPGTGGLRACMKSHMAEVSDPCKDAVSQTAAGKKLLGGGDL